MLTMTAAQPARCRVALRAERAAAAAQTLGAALSALRAAQDDCLDCAQHETCQARTWHADIDTALRDIAAEWGLI